MNINKYNLTIEQIQDIIDCQMGGRFCRNNCYGCYGDDHVHTQCEWCVPKMEQYIESKYVKQPTLEEIIRKWNEKDFIYKTTDEEIVIHKRGYPKSIIIDTTNFTYTISFWVDYETHLLLTTTIEVLKEQIYDC